MQIRPRVAPSATHKPTQDDVNVRVPGAKHRACGSRQQAEAVEVITPGRCGQQQNGVGNEMAQNLWIRRQISLGTESEGPEAKVGEAKHQRAA